MVKGLVYILTNPYLNRQNLIVEGCYIPFDWVRDFDEPYRSEIRHICLIMSERYIREHFDSIKAYANVIENRLDDSDCTMNILTRYPAAALSMK